MKKSKKIGKSLILPALTALAFGAVAAGTTYALFTSEAKSEVSVVSGKVLVEKTVSLTGGETLVDGEVTEITASAGTLNFECGGTATIGENGDVELKNIVAGDKVTVKVHAANKSNVDIKYRAIVTTAGDFADIVSFEGKADGEVMKNSQTGLFTKYATAKSGTEDLGDYELTFGIDKDTKVTDGSTRSGTVTIKIEAIQGNAQTKDESEYFKVTTTKGLVETVNEADSGSTIEVASEVDLEETLSVSKDLNLILDSNITAPAGQNAIVVEKGSTLTLDGTTVASTPSGRIKRAVDKKSPVISTSGKQTTTIVVDGGKAVVSGVKVVSENHGAIAVKNGGELVIDGGEFTGVEFGAMAFDASKLTINGGTFTATDNFIVGTNGTSGRGKNVITINGGTFNGYIKSSGYIGCGVYVANDDTVTINDGTFNIENGCGVLARSGNTTVADKVAFNFTNDVDGIKEGWVGDKSANVPVNARIVKDLSKATYPGGVPTVIGSNVLDMMKTDGKTYFVKTEDDIQAALADSDNATKYIYVENDIELADKLEIANKDTVIYGDGVTLKLTTSAYKGRVVALYGDDHQNINGGSFGLVGVNAIRSDTTIEGQAVFTYALSDFKITIDNASLAAKYPFAVGDGSKSVEVVARGMTSTGYSAFQVSGDSDFTATFEDCTLNGYNTWAKDTSNDYGTIVVGAGVEGVNFAFKDCKITSDNEPNFNAEYFLLAKSGSAGAATFERCDFEFCGEKAELTDYLRNYSESFTTTVL